MFRGLFQRFPIPQSHSESHPVEEKKKEDNSAQVFVWSGGVFNGLGHVALQLDGEKPKYEEGEPGDYLSIWPKSTPAGGFTSVWPLEATLCKELKKDCMQEAPRPPADFTDLLHPDPEIQPRLPDKVYTVEGLDKEKIKTELNRLKTGMESKTVCYQLLPGANVAGFFRKVWSKDTTPGPKVYNCVTLTQHLLETGGVPLPKASWTTPSKFADRLSQQPQVKLNSSPKFK